MANEPSPQELLLEVCRRDPRYPLEAYEFLFAALGHIQHQLKENGPSGNEPLAPEMGPTPLSSSSPGKERGGVEGPHHVTGQQLAEGCRDLARNEFGLMARTVFARWGINHTDDFGEMVYNLIGAGLLSRTETDKKEDFHNVYDLDKELRFGYRIDLEGK